MGYLHIDNLYKVQLILMFKECYALEKIHGTSSHITWDFESKRLTFHSGGEPHGKFVSKFDVEAINKVFLEKFPNHNVKIYGEAYGGKQQSMSNTYGKELKFVAFDVNINDMWLNVPNAENVCKAFNIEFVDYVKITTDLSEIDAQRDRDSVQAIRNGMGAGKLREGIVLRPLIEVTLNNGDRIICKHKRYEFMETKTPRQVSTEGLKVLEDAKEIANEWVTEMRLTHILDKLPGADRKSTAVVLQNMVDDIYREGVGEIVESKEVSKAIKAKATELFFNRLKVK